MAAVKTLIVAVKRNATAGETQRSRHKCDKRWSRNESQEKFIRFLVTPILVTFVTDFLAFPYNTVTFTAIASFLTVASSQNSVTTVIVTVALIHCNKVDFCKWLPLKVFKMCKTQNRFCPKHFRKRYFGYVVYSDISNTMK